LANKSAIILNAIEWNFCNILPEIVHRQVGSQFVQPQQDGRCRPLAVISKSRGAASRRAIPRAHWG
jgi:hypothetical protein